MHCANNILTYCFKCPKAAGRNSDGEIISKQPYYSHEMDIKLRPRQGATHLDFHDERARLALVDSSRISICHKRGIERQQGPSMCPVASTPQLASPSSLALVPQSTPAPEPLAKRLVSIYLFEIYVYIYSPNLVFDTDQEATGTDKSAEEDSKENISTDSRCPQPE